MLLVEICLCTAFFHTAIIPSAVKSSLYVLGMNVILMCLAFPLYILDMKRTMTNIVHARFSHLLKALFSALWMDTFDVYISINYDPIDL